MRDILWPPLRAGPSPPSSPGSFCCCSTRLRSGLGDLLTLLVGAAAIVLVTAWLTTVLIGRRCLSPSLRRLVDRSEALASLPPPEQPPSEFDELVAQALDELPQAFREVLEHTPVVISNLGASTAPTATTWAAPWPRDTFPTGS